MGDKSSDSKEEEKAAETARAFPTMEGGGRCGENAEEIRGLGCLFRGIKSKNRCLWDVLRSVMGVRV